MMTKNISVGDKVQVTFSMIGKEDWVFVSEVMDVATGGVWVDHPECRGEDMMFINLSNPNINKVEVIPEVVEIEENQDMKAIKADLMKAIKYEDEVSIRVMVYDCTETGRQTYDVEINYYIDGEYADGFYNQTFVGRYEEDEVAEKMAVKRAKAVLRTVKGWFQYNNDVEVLDGVEVYHV